MELTQIHTKIYEIRGKKMIANESEFEDIGLYSFFDNEYDKTINWEDYFGIK